MNTNFGGATRKGVNNLFYNLKNSLQQNVIGIRCAAHETNNTVQTAADYLLIDVESIIVKMYFRFYIYTVRVESFKQFCENAAVE